jgi:hypothetical protein
MAGVESTPCCCQEDRPCCVTVTREVGGDCACLQRGECPDSIPCDAPPPPTVVQTRFVRCTGSASECDELAQEYCDQTPNAISCTGTYFSDLTCDQIEEAECESLPYKICSIYTCGWCGPIVTGCYIDYTDSPCPSPPTCKPDPCCDSNPPTICCCRREDGVREVVAPCGDPPPPNCVTIQDPADCANCGEYYTVMPCSSICCCTEPNCITTWDLTPQPGGHSGSGAISCGYSPLRGCITSQAQCNGQPLVLTYCCCSCYPCSYCSTDIAAKEACIQQALAASNGLCDTLCPVTVTGLCGCGGVSPLTGSSESAALPPVKSLESGVVLDKSDKTSLNTIFLLGYGTFNI